MVRHWENVERPNAANQMTEISESFNVSGSGTQVAGHITEGTRLKAGELIHHFGSST